MKLTLVLILLVYALQTLASAHGSTLIRRVPTPRYLVRRKYSLQPQRQFRGESLGDELRVDEQASQNSPHPLVVKVGETRDDAKAKLLSSTATTQVDPDPSRMVVVRRYLRKSLPSDFSNNGLWNNNAGEQDNKARLLFGWFGGGSQYPPPMEPMRPPYYPPGGPFVPPNQTEYCVEYMDPYTHDVYEECEPVPMPYYY